MRDARRAVIDFSGGEERQEGFLELLDQLAVALVVRSLRSPASARPASTRACNGALALLALEAVRGRGRHEYAHGHVDAGELRGTLLAHACDLPDLEILRAQLLQHVPDLVLQAVAGVVGREALVDELDVLRAPRRRSQRPGPQPERARRPARWSRLPREVNLRTDLMRLMAIPPGFSNVCRNRPTTRRPGSALTTVIFRILLALRNRRRHVLVHPGLRQSLSIEGQVESQVDRLLAVIRYQIEHRAPAVDRQQRPRRGDFDLSARSADDGRHLGIRAEHAEIAARRNRSRSATRNECASGRPPHRYRRASPAPAPDASGTDSPDTSRCGSHRGTPAPARILSAGVQKATMLSMVSSPVGISTSMTPPLPHGAFGCTQQSGRLL